MHNFRNLVIWQKARSIVKNIYEMTEKFPNKDFARFLEIALSSCFELETQVILSNDMSYITENECNEKCALIQEEQKMIHNFIKSLKE